jgi:ABC-type uncharacterized transport system auxiliary subunit
MKTFFPRHTLLLAALPLLLAGCLGSSSSQQQAAARKRTFVPVAAAAPRLATAPRFAALKVRACRVLPPFDARAFIVRRAGGEVVEDYYNGWIAPPQDLLRVQVARHLEQAGLFEAVVDAAAATQTPLGLEAVASDLCLDFTGERPAATVTLRLLLLDDRTPTFTVLFTEERTGRAPFDAADPAAPAQAFGQALTQALEALEKALASAPLPPARPSDPGSSSP